MNCFVSSSLFLLITCLKLTRAQTVAPVQGDLRLVGGSSDLEGRVEVYLQGTWGTVCDDGWSNRNAMVVCRQLNHSALGAVYLPRGRFGQGTGPILLDDVVCSGDELRLLDCSIPMRAHDCQHSEDVGVMCLQTGAYDPPNGNLRLNGSANSYEGRLEIFANGIWGTVCDDFFGNHEAAVVCRQLGLETTSASMISPVVFGSGSGQIWLDNVDCTGSEERLIECDHHPLGDHNCAHSEDVGISCPPQVTEDAPVRLAGGTSSSGRVEIFINNVWGTVCDDYWDNLDAMVVCRQLNFSTAGAVAITTGFTNGVGQIWLDDLHCLGNETNLLQCRNRGTGVHNCGHVEDAGVNCTEGCPEGAVRLQGLNPRSGRVEVCHNNLWGTVCDDSWDNTDAQVVCAQLRFPSAGAVAITNGFSNGAGQIWLDDVRCTGTESRLIDCPSGPLGINDCQHSQDAGVVCVTATSTPCDNGTLRLVNGNSNLEGRVEICNNNSWGTVCDDFWDNVDAGVACGQLGFSPIGATALRFAYFGPGTGSILLDNLMCHGNETRLADCAHNTIGSHNCFHTEDAGLRCSACTNGTVRLLGGATHLEGRVEICINGEFGTVCDDSWDNEDAAVVCRQLGYSTTGATTVFTGFTNGAGPIWLDEVQCTGAESRLIDCPASSVGEHNCGHWEDAGVRCHVSQNGDTGSLRLAGGISSYSGRVEIYINGVWGTVCDDFWSNQDAMVVCRQLNFSASGAQAVANSRYGSGTGPILLDDVACLGDESWLLDCRHGGIGNHNCQSTEIAGVMCVPGPNQPRNCTEGAVRLVNGSSEQEGRVEVCVGNMWGTVCDDVWGLSEAMVVCRQLDLPITNVTALGNARFGQGTLPIVLDQVTCTGNEASLTQCTHQRNHDCSHHEDAGVRCLAATPPPPGTSVGDIRLEGGSNILEGRVEIFTQDSLWATVCDDSWGDEDATVVCRQLGFPTEGAEAYGSAHYGTGSFSQPILLDDVNCDGDETRLLDCDHRGLGSHNCRHTEDASVKCMLPPVPGPPAGVRVDLSESDCSVATISWEIPSEYEYPNLISEYRVQITTLVEGGRTWSVTSLSRSVTLSNLQCDTAFYITISSFVFHYSNPSNITYFVTSPATTTEPSVDTGESRSVSYTWVVVFPVVVLVCIACLILAVALFLRRRKKRVELHISSGSDSNQVHVQANKFAVDNSPSIQADERARVHSGGAPRYQLSSLSEERSYVTDT